MKIKSLAILVILIIALCMACEQSEDDKNKKEEPVAAETKKADETKAPAIKDQQEQPEELSGSHILVPYKGAQSAPADTSYTKEEAQKMATEIIGKLKKDPSQFEEMARMYSSCPSSKTGGDLGTWNKGQMVPAFDEAIEKLKVGEITDKPVETPFGFHVIRRNKGLEKIEVSAQQIMIQYKGAMTAQNNNVTRDKKEAEKLAKEIAQKAKANPDSFIELSKKYNDAPTEKLPIWTTGTRMPKTFDTAVMPLKIGQISDAVESPFGFHIFKRIEVVHLPKRSGSHIMITYKGARMAPPRVTRTKEEANKLVMSVLEEVKKNPDKFKEIAMKKSEDPSVALNGGSLGVWEEGEMLPQFEEVFSKLKIGEIGGPVESVNGFHILKRDPVPDEK